MKYLQLFDAFITDIPTEVNDFLKIVKDKSPTLYARFYAMVKNKGLAVSMEEYDKVNPDVLKLKAKQEKSKITKEKGKELKDEMKDLLPDKSQTNSIINEYLLTDDLRHFLQKLGVNQPSTDGCSFNLSSNQQEGSIKVNLATTEKYDLKLNGSTRFLDKLNREYNLSEEIMRTSNKQRLDKGLEKTLHDEYDYDTENFEARIRCEIQIDLYRSTGLRIHTFFRIEYYNNNDYSKDSILTVHPDFERKQIGVIDTVSSNDFKAQFAITKIIMDSLKDTLIKLKKNIMAQSEQAIILKDKVEEKLLIKTTDIIKNSGKNSFNLLNKIKTSFPAVYAKIKPIIGNEESEIGTELGGLGF